MFMRYSVFGTSWSPLRAARVGSLDAIYTFYGHVIYAGTRRSPPRRDATTIMYILQSTWCDLLFELLASSINLPGKMIDFIMQRVSTVSRIIWGVSNPLRWSQRACDRGTRSEIARHACTLRGIRNGTQHAPRVRRATRNVGETRTSLHA